MPTSKVKNDYAGTIRVSPDNNQKTLYKHQEDAVKALNRHITGKPKKPFGGLVVVPTGGGKTLTAVQWLLRQYIDRQKKVLWVAHRHELLDQAFDSVKNNAYANLLKQRNSFTYRIISGIHDRPVNIHHNDDILFASKDSLIQGIDYLLGNWRVEDADELLLVIDEAHHAPAKTYRQLIDAIKKHARHVNLVGLTATPFRMAEDEQGALGKIFPENIVYKIGLDTLIAHGILAKPIFEECSTNIDFTHTLTEDDI